VTVVAWPGELDRAIGLAGLAEREAEWPGLGRRRPPPIRLLVVPDARRFAAVTAGRVPAWGAGIALPGSRTIVLRGDAGDLPRTLRHEVAHLVLHQAIRSRVPLWFDEGWATWAAGGTAGFDALSLNLGVARGAVGELRTLDGALRGTAGDAGLAYPLAASAVQELARRHPEGSLRPLLEQLAAGEDFAVAVRRTTGLTLAQFELAWRKAVRLRYGLLTWSLAAGLWLLLSTLVLVAAWARRHADRPRREALNVGWPLPPPDESESPPAEPGPPPGPAPGTDSAPETGEGPELDPTPRQV